jgi:hypothetical protein
VFENRMLGKISGPTKEEAKRSWRKFHIEELHKMRDIS